MKIVSRIGQFIKRKSEDLELSLWCIEYNEWLDLGLSIFLAITVVAVIVLVVTAFGSVIL